MFFPGSQVVASELLVLWLSKGSDLIRFNSIFMLFSFVLILRSSFKRCCSISPLRHCKSSSPSFRRSYPRNWSSSGLYCWDYQSRLLQVLPRCLSSDEARSWGINYWDATMWYVHVRIITLDNRIHCPTLAFCVYRFTTDALFLGKSKYCWPY